MPNFTERNRFLPSDQISARDVIQCGYDAASLIDVCAALCRSEEKLDARSAGAVASCLEIAWELMGPVLATVEQNQPAIDDERASPGCRSPGGRADI
tara:strand:+ start:5571 stop:5861 length:291 start_codon:yes stop_codon:yes gene_type:complete